MARLIAADTSTRATGVALYEWDGAAQPAGTEATAQPAGAAAPDQGVASAFRGRLLAGKIVEQDRMRAEELLSVLDELYQEAGIARNAVDAYVVALGPGSFTGLRIGVTMLKTMAQFSGKPVLGVSTLEALAFAAKAEAETLGRSWIVPVVDARANRVYAAAYTVDPQAPEGWRAVLPENLYLEEELIEKLNELAGDDPHLLWAGEGASRHAKLAHAFPGSAMLEGEAALSPVVALAELGARRLAAGQKDDPLALAPHYLRPSQAERQAGQRRGK